MEVFNILWNKYDEDKQYIIGYLIYDQKWIFKYNQELINEAIKKGFRPFLELPLIDKVYTSNKLFKTFSNRLGINKKKPSIMILKEKKGKLITDNIIILHKKTKRKGV